MSVERVLYLSYFYPLDVVKSRGLPIRNIAGNNRIKRIGGALASAGQRAHIVSPGICARCGFTSRLFHGSYRTREDGIDVTVAPAFVVPFIGAMLEVVLFPLWVLLLLRRGRYDGAIFYNYSLSFALLALFFRLFGLPFVAQVEDVVEPAGPDWRREGGSSPLRQSVLGASMKVIAHLSAGLVVPSQRFRKFLPKNKPCLVVPGCVADSEWSADRPVELRSPLRALFVGPYQTEHGVDLFLATLKLLRAESPVAARYEFDCCGTNSYSPELLSLSASEGTPLIRLHGLLSDDEYRTLLGATAVALVLQKGQGRLANYRSPSKAFEFLAAGKLVIATDVGDLASYAGDQLILLKDESAEELVKVFGDIAEKPEEYQRIAQAAREFSLREFSYAAVGQKLAAFLTDAFGVSHPRSQGSPGTLL